MLSFVLAHQALSWFLLGVLCLMLEMLLPAFFIFFFGLGAWCAALAAALAAPPSVQVVVFVAASLALLVLLRTKCRQLFRGTVLKGAADDVLPENTLAEVVEDILPPGPGKVKYGGTFWQATSTAPAARGTRVRVLAKSNLTLTVEAVAAPESDQATQSPK